MLYMLLYVYSIQVSVTCSQMLKEVNFVWFWSTLPGRKEAHFSTELAHIDEDDDGVSRVIGP